MKLYKNKRLFSKKTKGGTKGIFFGKNFFHQNCMKHTSIDAEFDAEQEYINFISFMF